jgi:LPXTG-site transpeptidase (sortase) family protein
MQRFRWRLSFTGRSFGKQYLLSLRDQLRFKFLRPFKKQSVRQSSLFALVVVLMLFGTIIGWEGKNVLDTSIFMNYLLHANITFTPVPEQTGTHARVHNTSDQISTNFDPSSGRLLISSVAPIHLTEQPLMSTATPTIDPGMRTSHMDTGSRLQIPALSIDAPIETVGTQKNGTMDVPLLHLLDGVGWYQNGPWPGQRGSAVIDGYVSHADSSAAIFSQLGDLHEGDLILIVNPDGSEQHFHVMSLSTYLPDNVPLAHIFRDASGVYLNLITCNDAWTSVAQQTIETLIVHAVQN